MLKNVYVNISLWQWAWHSVHNVVEYNYFWDISFILQGIIHALLVCIYWMLPHKNRSEKWPFSEKYVIVMLILNKY